MHKSWWGKLCSMGVIVLIMHRDSSKSSCDVALVLSEFILCLSVTISLIRSKGGERKDREVLSMALPHTPIPPQTPSAPSSPSASVCHSRHAFMLWFRSLLKAFHSFGKLSAHLSSISTHLTSSLPIAATAKAIITFHPSIKHSQLWSISTLSPLCSTALNLKCLPSVSVSTYLSADKAILDWRVDDYYNRFHNAFQHYACVCVFCKWNRWEVIYSHCPCASLLHSS